MRALFTSRASSEVAKVRLAICGVAMVAGKVKWCTSLSATIVLPDAAVNVAALAVMATVCAPSRSVSSTPAATKLALVAPAAMVTLAVTVSCAGFAERSVTVSGVGSVPEMETVPLAVAPSETEAGGAIERLRVSLSVTWIVAVASVEPDRLAVIVAI